MKRGLLYVVLAAASLGMASACAAAELGPGKARGMIIYTVQDDSPEGLPPILGFVRDDGWDVTVNRVAVDFSHDHEIAQVVFARIRQAEMAGYGKVVLAGESFGAWVSLLANSSWTTPVEGGHLHALIVIDPSVAAVDGSDGGRWHEYKFLNVLKSQDSTRLALFLYDATADDRDQREDEVVRMLRNPRLPRVVSVEADTFAGPNGPRSTAFARRWRHCLTALLDEITPAACVPGTASQPEGTNGAPR